ncbi:hypothetical protein RBSWK_03639 [Rhodopirellula baltica SWK14]|uniref:Uncharacterized protein n=1 Tax=Rhodopirellula baltica SWK14 TaxID=993516 RepID=L7CFZ4_RHOBT|nr:hypothetical protein RBSWK_03639 [Rhodopirellula baltica SWK14]
MDGVRVENNPPACRWAAKHLRRIGDQAIPWQVAPQQSLFPLHLATQFERLEMVPSNFGHRRNPSKNLKSAYRERFRQMSLPLAVLVRGLLSSARRKNPDTNTP